LKSNTIEELIREAKAKNLDLMHMISRGEINHYATYAGLELCRVNRLLITVLETLIQSPDPDQRSGTSIDKEITENSL